GSSDHNRLPILGPSPRPDPILRELPKEIEQDEIARLVEHFGLATANAKAAGLDGVEIFAAQGYGISQFLSPLSNVRTDEYGGPLENRMRLLLRVVSKVRAVAGTDFLIG